MSLPGGIGQDVRYAARSRRRRPALVAVAVAVLAAVAATARHFPARRAARLDPAAALRRE